MTTKQLPIGGEFWFSRNLQLKEKQRDIREVGMLLSGGKSAIEFILKDISFKKDEVLLVPSFLCPTIISFIKRLDIKYEFYNVKKNLSIDLDELQKKSYDYNVKCIFFINYFGFYHSEETIRVLKELQENGIVLIEDAVQMFWLDRNEKFIGDYVFNSYRKFLPIDGSLLLCSNLVEIKEPKDSYYKYMKIAREQKTRYIYEKEGSEEEFLSSFSKAHSAYYERNKIFGINTESEEFLNYINFDELTNRRNENFKYVYKELKKIKNIKVLFDESNLNGNIPLVIPILTSERDKVRLSLMGKKIYCPIHWDLSNEEWIDRFGDSTYISNNILSIPIDWRYDLNDMEYLILNLKEAIS